VAAVERRLNTPNRSFAILGNAFLGEQAPLAEGGFMVLAEVTSGRVREGDRAVSEALLGRNLTASSGRGRLTAPAFFEVAHTGFVPRGSLPNSRTPWWSREAVYYGGAAVFGTVMVGWLAMRVMRRRSLGLSGPQLVRLNPRSDLWAPADLGPTEAVESPSRAEASGGGTPEASSALAVRENLVPHLARLVKDRILWTLIRQRRQMLRTQDLSSQRVMALEQRLALLQSQLARQTRAYEDRIRELEGEVARLREQPRG
jgi:hypothetical protein